MVQREGDEAKALESASEGIASVLDVGENIVYMITDTIGLPSVRRMADEMRAEIQASDLVCDRVGGEVVEIPNPVGPNLDVCISPRLITEAIKSENLGKTGEIAASCAVEELVTEPIDFVLGLGEIVEDKEYERLSGWIAGLLGGEAAPLLNAFQWFTLPAQLSACVQAKVAKDITGDLTEAEYSEMSSDIFKFTGRDTGMARRLLEKSGL